MENHDSVSLYVSSVITVVFNSITGPLTFLLNVLVIMAVKRTSRLQTKANMLLACLAVTDAFTGLLTQPLFIMVWKAFYLLEVPDEDAVGTFYLCFTWFDHLFSASSDVGDRRETDSHQIHLSSPSSCHRAKY